MKSLSSAVERVRRGELVAYPTETVWGLGANAASEAAVARLGAWKGRDADQPISILVEGPPALEALGFQVGAAARRLMERFWPGPLTVVLPCTGHFAPGIARAADSAVGVRCSSHPVAFALARGLAEAGVGPVTATSLNHRGESPTRDLDTALALCGGGSDAPEALERAGAAPCAGGHSTVVDATGPLPRVLRAGSVETQAIEACLAEVASR